MAKQAPASSVHEAETSTHDVFVSYAGKDQMVANAACHALEAEGIRCWIAPRDVAAGVHYGGAITGAIRRSRVMVLVFSQHANLSDHILTEVSTAFDASLPIVSVRIEDVTPVDALDYYLRTRHWLDAFPEPAEHFARLIQQVRALVPDRGPQPAEQPSGKVVELPLTARLTVSTVPPGAAVTIEGRAAGTTPLTLKANTPGGQPRSVRVEVQLAGYEPRAAQIDLIAGATSRWEDVALAKLPQPAAAPAPARQGFRAALKGLFGAPSEPHPEPAGTGTAADLSAPAAQPDKAQPKPEPPRSPAPAPASPAVPVNSPASPPPSVSAPTRQAARPARNDCCWCGSGKKYRCCCEQRDGGSGQTGEPAPGHAGALPDEVLAAARRTAAEAEAASEAQERALELAALARAVLALDGVIADLHKKERDDSALDALEMRERAQDGMTQVLIPAGEFPMGSPETDLEANSYEKPQRTVYVSEFWMDEHPVTVAQYRDFCQAVPGREMPPPPDWGWNDAHPIVNVTWDEASAYAEWVGGALPTEAQWEKAARGGATTRYPWGDLWDPELANGAGTVGKTTLVCYYDPNDFGLFDMIGNVRVWCVDVWNPGWYLAMPLLDPQCDSSDMGIQVRVQRGGSWDQPVDELRVATRSWDGDYSDEVGFRCIGGATKDDGGSER